MLVKDMIVGQTVKTENDAIILRTVDYFICLHCEGEPSFEKVINAFWFDHKCTPCTYTLKLVKEPRPKFSQIKQDGVYSVYYEDQLCMFKFVIISGEQFIYNNGLQKYDEDFDDISDQSYSFEKTNQKITIG